MTELDRRILDMETRRYRYDGMKTRAIRDELDLSPTAYYQRLNQLLDDPDAALANPTLIHRLRRQRDRAAYLKTARRRTG